jgi:hypothetical protein
LCEFYRQKIYSKKLVWNSLRASIFSGIAKGLNALNDINVPAVGAVNLFSDLRLNISSAPPAFAAIAAKMVQKF